MTDRPTALPLRSAPDVARGGSRSSRAPAQPPIGAQPSAIRFRVQPAA